MTERKATGAIYCPNYCQGLFLIVDSVSYGIALQMLESMKPEEKRAVA